MVLTLIGMYLFFFVSYRLICTSMLATPSVNVNYTISLSDRLLSMKLILIYY